MKFLKFGDERTYDKARKRLDKVTVPAAHDWAETSLWAIQEGLEGARSTRDRAALQQARTGAIGLLAAIDSVLDRTG